MTLYNYEKHLRREGHAALIGGVFVRRIKCELTSNTGKLMSHDRYEIGCEGSGHTLAVDSTDAERLEAHVRNHMTDKEMSKLHPTCYPLTDIAEGDVLDWFINQADRDCEVAKINRTRCRLEYEMPNAGPMGGWHPIYKDRSGQAYLIRQ